MSNSEQLRRVRVLCVDDNDLLRRALVVALRRIDWIEVVGERDRADALPAVVQEGRPDVVLLDLDMPGDDPFAAMAELQSSRADARVLVFTGHARTDFADRAIECGAWGYLSKSADIDGVVRAIHAVHSGSFVFDTDAPEE